MATARRSSICRKNTDDKTSVAQFRATDVFSLILFENQEFTSDIV